MLGAAASLSPALAQGSLLKGAVAEGLSRGFNLPDQAPARADQKPDLSILKTLRRLGMTHVRLPVVAEFVLPALSGPATISSATDDLAQALDQLLDLGYSVSVDMHPDGDFQGLYRRDPKAAQDALLGGWRLLARRLTRYPADRVHAELLNEPPTTDEIWRPFAEKLAKVVREELPRNILIVGPAPTQRHDALASWRPFADANVVYAFHYYDPMAFTHQYALWDKGSAWSRISGVPFPTQAGDATLLRMAQDAARRKDNEVAQVLRDMASQAWTAETIKAQFEMVAAWSAAHSAPVIVNEFGVLRWKARRADRLAWLAAVRSAAEACGFGWAHWDYSTSFGLVNEDGSLDRAVTHALLGA
ncbi:MAG: endoglucanase [Methylocystis sp.]|nr:MAG: endoglucanase [Methylocystis sp.]